MSDHSSPEPENSSHRTFGWNWRTNAGHLLFLNTFLKSRLASYHPSLPGRATWEAALGKSPDKAIERFRVQGMLTTVSTQEHLSLLLTEKTVAELTALLYQHDLPVSGRKPELVERLVTGAGLKLAHLLPAETLLRCTPYGAESAPES